MTRKRRDICRSLYGMKISALDSPELLICLAHRLGSHERQERGIWLRRTGMKNKAEEEAPLNHAGLPGKMNTKRPSPGSIS